MMLSMKFPYSCQLTINLLVEGDSDYNCHQIGEEKVNIVISDGCENIVEAIKTIDNDDNLRDSLGVIDRDYRQPLGKVPDSKNIVMTDWRDLETMMFATRAFFKVITEKGSHSKIDAFDGKEKGIREKVVSLAKPIGCLRYYSQKSGKYYDFQGKKGLSVEKFS
jgi:hypothetical protein